MTADERLSRLTPTQREVVRLLCSGVGEVVEIGELMGVKRSTARTHMRDIYDRLGVRNKVALVVYVLTGVKA